MKAKRLEFRLECYRATNGSRLPCDPLIWINRSYRYRVQAANAGG